MVTGLALAEAKCLVEGFGCEFVWLLGLSGCLGHSEEGGNGDEVEIHFETIVMKLVISSECIKERCFYAKREM